MLTPNHALLYRPQIRVRITCHFQAECCYRLEVVVVVSSSNRNSEHSNMQIVEGKRMATEIVGKLQVSQTSQSIL